MIPTTRSRFVGTIGVVLLTLVAFSPACIFSSSEETGVGDDSDATTTDTSDSQASDGTDDVQDDTSATDVADADQDATDADVTDTDAADVAEDAEDTDQSDADCASGEEECDGACVDTSTSVDHCGGCGERCEPPPNATATCESETCVFACKDGFVDLNGNLQDADSDGCEGACSENEVGTYYFDGDSDSYGDPTKERDYCAGTQPTTYVANSADCDDGDDRVNPDYNGGFQTVASSGGAGTFDYNCNNTLEEQFPSSGRCTVGTNVCNSTEGWQGSVPSCGDTGAYVTGCGTLTNGCMATTTQKTQGCK